ncbi:MAG TPA: hypothetical protein EYG86_05245, partial [Crocinitomicaceae bacterium]|nr:hypothetical protein [Crocinitomicaceae bacterium]
MVEIREIVDWYRDRGNRVILSEATSMQLIKAPKAINSARVEHLSFINGKFATQCNELIQSANCQLILVDEVLESNLKELPTNISFVFSKNPKEDVVAFCKEFLNFEAVLSETVIHSSATIASDVQISGCVTIASGVVLEENVKIGDNCKIGANTIIHANTIIGNNVDIGANNVIGGVGFGYAQNSETKEYEQFPHYGSVIIHNDVSIGNNTCIDRGSLSDTIIHDG